MYFELNENFDLLFINNLHEGLNNEGFNYEKLYDTLDQIFFEEPLGSFFFFVKN